MNDYIAVCPDCHNVVAWLHAELDKKHIARDIAKWVRQGLSVERVTTDEARRMKWGHAEMCAMDPKTKKRKATV